MKYLFMLLIGLGLGLGAPIAYDRAFSYDDQCRHDSRFEKGDFQCTMVTPGTQLPNIMQIQVFGATYADLSEAFKRASNQLKDFGKEQTFNVIGADLNRYGYKIEAGVVTKPASQAVPVPQSKPVAPVETKRPKTH